MFIKYGYNPTSLSVFATDLYGGAKADLTDTEVFTDNIDMTSDLFATLEFKFTGNNATDDLEIKLYRSLSDTWDGDEIAIDSIVVSNDGSEDLYSYIINQSFAPGHYRFGLASSSTNTTFDIEVKTNKAILKSSQ